MSTNLLWNRPIRWLRKQKLLTVLVASLIALCVLLISTAFFYKYSRLMFPTRPTGDILIIGIMGALTIIIGSILLSRCKLRTRPSALIWIWLAILILSGISFSLVFPPGAVPDESYHFLQAYAFANLFQGLPASDHATNMRMTDLDLFRNLRTIFQASDYATLKESALPILVESDSRFFYPTKWGSEVDLESLPQTRIPAALGIMISQILHLNGTWTFYIGRFFNFIAFAALAFFAVRSTPIARPAFMALCMIPGVLHFVSSYSYDAIIIGLSLLLIALCLKCFYEPQSIGMRHLVAMLVVTGLLAPCKSIYSALILLVLFIPKRCFSSPSRTLLFKGGALAVLAGSILLFSSSYIASVLGLDQESTPTQAAEVDPANTRHTLSEFITDPIRTAFIYLNTIVEQGSFQLNSFLGGSLGWFTGRERYTIGAPWLFLIPYIVILFISVQRFPTDSKLVSGKQKLLFGVVCGLVYLGVHTAMFTASTISASLCIQGVQGRYFIPIALLLLLVLRFKAIRLESDPAAPLLIGLFALNQAYLQFIYTTTGLVPA